MFEKIDSRLIVLFESFAHWWQRLTGKDNFWLGWAALWGQLIIMLLMDYIITIKRGAPLFLVYALLDLLVFRYLLRSIRRILGLLTPMMGESQKVNGRNPLECLPLGKVLRKISIFLFFVQVAISWRKSSLLPANVAIFLLVCMWYFFSCTPLPPGESKVGRFLNSLRAFASWRPATSGAS